MDYVNCTSEKNKSIKKYFEIYPLPSKQMNKNAKKRMVPPYLPYFFQHVTANTEFNSLGPTSMVKFTQKFLAEKLSKQWIVPKTLNFSQFFKKE